MITIATIVCTVSATLTMLWLRSCVGLLAAGELTSRDRLTYVRRAIHLIHATAGEVALCVAVLYSQAWTATREVKALSGHGQQATLISEPKQKPGYHAVLNRPDGTRMTVNFTPPKEKVQWLIQ